MVRIVLLAVLLAGGDQFPVWLVGGFAALALIGLVAKLWPQQRVGHSGKRLSDNYITYMRSRDWKAKRDQVRRRAGGKCEHCRRAPLRQVHHLTYARFGHEDLTDLLGVCVPCHEFLGGKSGRDPAQAKGCLAALLVLPVTGFDRVGWGIGP